VSLASHWSIYADTANIYLIIYLYLSLSLSLSLYFFPKRKKTFQTRTSSSDKITVEDTFGYGWGLSPLYPATRVRVRVSSQVSAPRYVMIGSDISHHNTIVARLDSRSIVSRSSIGSLQTIQYLPRTKWFRVLELRSDVTSSSRCLSARLGSSKFMLILFR
jgi:hypothetical protein